MHKTFIAAFIVIFFFSCVVKESTVEPSVVAIVPQPVSITTGVKTLRVDGPLVIEAEGNDERHIAEMFTTYLSEVEANPQRQKNPEDVKVTFLIKSDSSKLEGYKLNVNESGIEVVGNSPAGLFYGMQTLLQMFTPGEKELAFVSIEDYPRFEYRGLHLDVARHMFPVAFVKKYIDLLAKHKLNTFHWHLTDDQGWRIEIKKYPKLTEVGGYRKETAIGRAGTKERAQAKFDGEPYGGFYTQEEIKEVVDYASDRYVTVIPEIEMPGHALAALAAYPELGCTGGPYETAKSWGIFDDVFCAGKEETFVFLQNVLDEVVTLFPSQYIHIGGDECWKNKWEKCPHCQRRIQNQNLKDEHELQSHFIQRIEKYLNSKGKKIIGWDEILEGGLAPNATVMSWRGEEGGIAAAQQNHEMIMTPEDWLYLDHAQDTTGDEPVLIRAYTPVEEVYNYEPVPNQLTPSQAKYVLGAQCNVWTEYMKTPEQVEYMAYPRVSALAEAVWSQKEAKNFDDFRERMQQHFLRLKAWDVNYAKHLEEQRVSAE